MDLNDSIKLPENTLYSCMADCSWCH